MKKYFITSTLLFLSFILKGQIITSIAGGGSHGLGDGGPATSAVIYDPGSGVFDKEGNY